jgi:hypothetical protein
MEMTTTRQSLTTTGHVRAVATAVASGIAALVASLTMAWVLDGGAKRVVISLLTIYSVVFALCARRTHSTATAIGISVAGFIIVAALLP